MVKGVGFGARVSLFQPVPTSVLHSQDTIRQVTFPFWTSVSLSTRWEKQRNVPCRELWGWNEWLVGPRYVSTVMSIRGSGASQVLLPFLWVAPFWRHRDVSFHLNLKHLVISDYYCYYWYSHPTHAFNEIWSPSAHRGSTYEPGGWPRK